MLKTFSTLRGQVSYVKAIDLFFIVSFMFVFGAVMEYILVILKCAMEENARQEREGRHEHLAQEMKKEYVVILIS